MPALWLLSLRPEKKTNHRFRAHAALSRGFRQTSLQAAHCRPPRRVHSARTPLTGLMVDGTHEMRGWVQGEGLQGAVYGRMWAGFAKTRHQGLPVSALSAHLGGESLARFRAGVHGWLTGCGHNTAEAEASSLGCDCCKDGRPEHCVSRISEEGALFLNSAVRWDANLKSEIGVPLTGSKRESGFFRCGNPWDPQG
jgi:hypothetical protein